MNPHDPEHRVSDVFKRAFMRVLAEGMGELFPDQPGQMVHPGGVQEGTLFANAEAIGIRFTATDAYTLHGGDDVTFHDANGNALYTGPVSLTTVLMPGLHTTIFAPVVIT